MPILPLGEVPGDVTLEDLAGLVGQQRLTLAWLMEVIDRLFVQQKGYAGRNVLADHGFEMLPTTGSADAYHTFAINTNYLTNAFWWDVQGSPRVRSIYSTSGVFPYSLFGYQGAIVNNTNYLIQRQFPSIDAIDGPYCFSVHAAPKGDNTVGATLTCTLVIRALTSLGGELAVATRSFTVAQSYSTKDNGRWTRGFVTAENLPANTFYLEVQVKSASAEWLEIDGAQLIQGPRPEVYNPENQLWAHGRSQDGTKHYNPEFFGESVFTNVVGTDKFSAHVAPGQGGIDKTVIASLEGFELKDQVSGGTVLYAVNSEGKNYAPWVQLQNDNATTSPLVGAIRSNGSVPQFYDGSAWRNFSPFSTPAARAYHSADQSITTATITALALDSERFDTDTIHDTATNNSRLTCKTAGKYLIGGHVKWEANVAGGRSLRIRLNGSTNIAVVFDGAADAAGDKMQCVSTPYDLAVNDYVELVVVQDSGGNLNINAVGNYSPEFWMVRVG